MVQKYISQICQKLAIAAALAAALGCLPVAAQTSQANEILILNDKPVTFAEFLKTYPNQAVRSKVLATLDEKSEDAFRDWEMAQLNKRSAEQDAEMARLNKRSTEQDIALNLYKELEVVFSETHKEQGSSNTVTPEQLARNKKRAMIIFAALVNPDLGGEWKPDTRMAMETLGKNLQAGVSLDSNNKILLKVLGEQFKSTAPRQ